MTDIREYVNKKFHDEILSLLGMQLMECSADDCGDDKSIQVWMALLSAVVHLACTRKDPEVLLNRLAEELSHVASNDIVLAQMQARVNKMTLSAEDNDERE